MQRYIDTATDCFIATNRSQFNKQDNAVVHQRLSASSMVRCTTTLFCLLNSCRWIIGLSCTNIPTRSFCVKFFPSHKVHRTALISVFSSLPDTSLTARSRTRGQCIAQCTGLFTSPQLLLTLIVLIRGGMARLRWFVRPKTLAMKPNRHQVTCWACDLVVVSEMSFLSTVARLYFACRVLFRCYLKYTAVCI